MPSPLAPLPKGRGEALLRDLYNLSVQGDVIQNKRRLSRRNYRLGGDCRSPVSKKRAKFEHSDAHPGLVQFRVIAGASRSTVRH